MKKIYKKPEIEIVRTEQSLPIAVSDPNVTVGGENDDVAAEELDVKSSRNVGNVWDDDWSR